MENWKQKFKEIGLKIAKGEQVKKEELNQRWNYLIKRFNILTLKRFYCDGFKYKWEWIKNEY